MYDPHREVADWPSGRSVDADALPDSAAIAETPRWWTGQYDNQGGIWLFKDGEWTLLYSDRGRYGGGVSSSTPAATSAFMCGVRTSVRSLAERCQPAFAHP